MNKTYPRTTGTLMLPDRFMPMLESVARYATSDGYDYSFKGIAELTRENYAELRKEMAEEYGKTKGRTA